MLPRGAERRRAREQMFAKMDRNWVEVDVDGVDHGRILEVETGIWAHNRLGQ